MMLLRLFREFFQTGLFAVGGGLATLPFLSRMADTTGWFTHSQLADMVAVSESTPGPIGVNMATYVGFLTAGVPGAIAATLGLVMPSILIILLIAAFLRSFRENRLVEGAPLPVRGPVLMMHTASGDRGSSPAGVRSRISRAARHLPIRPQPMIRMGQPSKAMLSFCPARRMAQSAVRAAFSAV